MATIQVGDSLRPRTVNTPLDERTVIATLSDMQNIDLPFVGMLVYCLADAKYYKVTALNQDLDAVASYEEFPNPSQGGGFSGSYNDLTGKPTFATINNQPIDQGGNISIPTGSSPATPILVPHSETNLTIPSLDGGTLHPCDNPLLSLTVSALGQNQSLESIILFQTAENWNGLSLPSGIRFAPMPPILYPQTHYLLCIQNAIAVISPLTE